MERAVGFGGASRYRCRAVMASLVLGLSLAGCNNTNSRVIDIYVAEQTVPCTAGVLQKNCLRVREGDPAAPLNVFYESIQGFNYEPGYRYHLRVERVPVKNPPQDASSMSYRLVAVVDKQRAG
jgi:Domain of unknown function (DUF4377)